MFLQAYGARLSAIVLLTATKTDSHSWAHAESPCGLPAHGLSTEVYATSCSVVDLISQVHGWMIKQIFDPAAIGTSSLKVG